MKPLKFLYISLFALTLSGAQLTSNVAHSTYKNYYAALAISEKSRAYGFSFNQSSKKKAAGAAMLQCSKNATDCTIKILTTDCLAFASAKGGGWGYAWSQKRSKAQARAMNQCSKHSKKCEIKVSVCNRQPKER